MNIPNITYQSPIEYENAKLTAELQAVKAERDSLRAALRRIEPYIMAELPATQVEPGPQYEHYHASKAVRAALKPGGAS